MHVILKLYHLPLKSYGQFEVFVNKLTNRQTRQKLYALDLSMEGFKRVENFFSRIGYSHCNRIHSCLTQDHCFDDGYV